MDRRGMLLSLKATQEEVGDNTATTCIASGSNFYSPKLASFPSPTPSHRLPHLTVHPISQTTRPSSNSCVTLQSTVSPWEKVCTPEELCQHMCHRNQLSPCTQLPPREQLFLPTKYLCVHCRCRPSSALPPHTVAAVLGASQLMQNRNEIAGVLRGCQTIRNNNRKAAA